MLALAGSMVGGFAVNRLFTVDSGGRRSEDGAMPEPDPSPSPSVYQLRVVLSEISPLIWRRLLVRSDTTLADLHAALQVAFCWDGFHLHRFKVHGREYEGVYDTRQVRLADLGLRVTERFVYDYDFTDFWRHDIRVEQILAVEAGRTYPVCTGGRRAGPPEDCGGPWAYLEGRQRHDIFAMASLLADMLGHPEALLGDYRDRLEELRPWLDLERFDARALNRALAGLPVLPKQRVA